MANDRRTAKRPGILKSFYIANRAVLAGWRPQTLSELDQWMDTAYGARGASGILVTQETANNFTAYFSGVLQISQTLGSCPLHLYRLTGKRAKDIFAANKLNTRLSVNANPYQDAYHWKEQMQHHAINWGNGYSWIQRDSNEQIIGLWPLNPDRTTIRMNDRNVPEYVYRTPGSPPKYYRWADVFHLAGFGFDGMQGYSLLSLFQDAIGLGLAQQEFSGRFLANGAHIPGFFEHPKELSEAAAKRLREDLKDRTAGLANTGKTPLLEEGMKYVPINMPLKDAEFLASRVFQLQEIARILNMSPMKLKDYTKLTYNNAEQLAIEWRTDTIRPWAERWEASINHQLLTPAQQPVCFAEFDLNAIVRGDMKTEYQAYKEGRYGGWLNADEIRWRLGENPIEDESIGRRYWQPTNMTDAANPKLESAPAPEPEETEEPEDAVEPEETEEPDEAPMEEGNE